MTEILGDNPIQAVADNLNGPATSEPGTAAESGQAIGQQAPTEETLGNIDPNTLPPQLKKTYDDMLRDYRAKTEGVSNRVKAELEKQLEPYKSKAEWYDAALKDEKLTKIINDYVNQAEQSNDPNAPQLPPEIKEKLAKVDELDREIKTTKAQELISAWAEAKDEKGNLLRPNFDKFHELKLGGSEDIGEYSLLRAAIDLSPGQTPHEKLENGYKAAQAVYDSIFEEGRKAGMGKLQEKAKNGTFAPSSVNANSTAPRKARNAIEAIEFARAGLLPNKD